MSGSHIGRWVLGLAVWAWVGGGAALAADANGAFDKGTVGGQTVSTFDLPPGASITVELDVVVDDPLAAGVTFLSNQGSLTGSNFPALSTIDPDPTPDPSGDAATDTLISAVAILGLTKTDGGISTVPGGSISYLLGFINTGNQDAGNAVLTDTVPLGTTFDAGASTAGWACLPDTSAGSTCTLGLGDLAGNGGNGMATFTVTVDDPVPAGFDQVANTAALAADGISAVMASDTTPVTAAPVLTLDKANAGAPVAPGDTLVFTLTYSNTGNEDAANAELTETVPASTTFNAGASTGGWACLPDANAGSTCTLALGTLVGGGGGGMAAFAVDVDNPVPVGLTQVDNTASLDADNVAAVMALDTAVVTASPDLTLSKDDGGATVVPGDTIAYTLSYANNGDQDAGSALLRETVPASTTFDGGASTPGWACLPDGSAGSTCTLALGTLAGGGGSGMATFAVAVVNPVPSGLTQITNDASLEASNATSAMASDATPVTAAPNLLLSKDDGGVTVAPGDTISYSLGYGNDGNQDADGAELVETVPVETVFDPAASTAGWICSPDGNAGSTCTLMLGTLGGGGANDGTAIFAVDVVNPVSTGFGQVDNTASLQAPMVSGVMASDSTPVDAAPDLTVTKDDGGVALEPGDTLTYSVSYANVGDQDATGVELTETVPAATVFNAAASDGGWTCLPDGNPGAICTLTAEGSGEIGGGASGAVDFAVDIDDPLPPGTTEISNTVSIADDGGSGPDGNPGDNSFTLVTGLDNEPPVITAVDTAAGPLADCDTVRRPVSSIQVSFDDLSEILGVGDPANFQLVGTGPDGDFSTTVCGAVSGDDVDIPLTVSTEGTPSMPRTRLQIGSVLGAGLYRLLVCDGIADLSGNSLDGDGDGVAGGNLLLGFRSDPFNLFTNGHFDSCPVTLTPWEFAVTPPNAVTAGAPGADDVDGSPLSASVNISNVVDAPTFFGQCLDVVGSGDLDFRVRARFAPVTTGVAFLRLQCAAFPVAACAGAPLGTTDPVTLLLEDSAGSWLNITSSENAPLSVPGGTRSVLCEVTIEADGLSDPNFEAHLDALFLAERAFFADGFESGDTSAWSSTQP